jgi:hypothetical protein
MRALHVYESEGFQRGRDPKRAMGIGMRPENEEAFCKYIISKLPEILGTESIPKNIIGGAGNYIELSYTDPINTFVKDLLIEYGINPLPGGLSSYWVNTESALGYNMWESLRKFLIKMGFSS